MSDAAPISQARLEANRRNASKSTGPKTAEGKAISHGSFAKSILVNGEEPGPFKQFKDALLRRLNPRDCLELKLVQRIISLHWRLDRVAAAERELYENAQWRAVRPEFDERQE